MQAMSCGGDKEVVLAAVQQNGNVLQYASDELRGDRELVLAAVLGLPRPLLFLWMVLFVFAYIDLASVYVAILGAVIPFLPYKVFQFYKFRAQRTNFPFYKFKAERTSNGIFSTVLLLVGIFIAGLALGLTSSIESFVPGDTFAWCRGSIYDVCNWFSEEIVAQCKGILASLDPMDVAIYGNQWVILSLALSGFLIWLLHG